MDARWLMGWAKGWALRPLWAVRARFGGTRIQVGPRFSLQGKLRARGPGTVTFGQDVVLTAFVTVDTLTREARVEIGDRCELSGTGFGCGSLIEVGADGLLANATVLDTDYHSVSRSRRQDGSVSSSPVRIGENVRIETGVCVLKGVSVGADVLARWGTVITSDVPPGRIVAGNPARDAGASAD